MKSIAHNFLLYKAGYDSNNLVFSELSLGSSWISLDRCIDSKKNWFLSILKGYMSESFLLWNSKIYVLLIALTSRMLQNS